MSLLSSSFEFEFVSSLITFDTGLISPESSLRNTKKISQSQLFLECAKFRRLQISAQVDGAIFVGKTDINLILDIFFHENNRDINLASVNWHCD